MNHPSDRRDLLALLYGRFNARDIEALLAQMHPEVDWANGWEGGHVHGRAGVRGYWTRQWAEIVPTVEPVDFTQETGGRWRVGVRQVVRDLDGRVLSDGRAQHLFTFEDGLIRRMDIAG